jgi:hypothetical protein
VDAQLEDNAVDIPVFTAASQDDTTVDTSATIEFMSHTLHPSSKLVLYSTSPGQVPSGISAGKVELVNSVKPEQKILSSAHTAIVLPPGDAHYGMNGVYSYCLHYYPDEKLKYDACNNTPGKNFQGELTRENLDAGIMRRLMYNPDFAALKISMKIFIDGFE